jgi:DNA-binding beta-propeller fold protein YncE
MVASRSIARAFVRPRSAIQASGQRDHRKFALAPALFVVPLWVAVMAVVPSSAKSLRADGAESSNADQKSRGTATGEDPDRAQMTESLTAHLAKVDPLALEAPEFPAGKEWFNSTPLTLAKELRGKIVILDFWTYCCINCIHVLPDLEYLERKYASMPVAVVGVHSAKFENERVSENIRQAVLRYEIRHPVVNDDEMALWRTIGVRAWPSLAVIGPRGNLLLMVSGEGNRDLIDTFISIALSWYPPETFRHDPLPIRLESQSSKASSPLRFPGKLAVDSDGKRLFISDSNHHRVVVTDLDGKFVDVIGSGRRGLTDGSFEEATFFRLQGLAFGEGKLWVADSENHALRLVDVAARSVKLVAGDGAQGRDYEGGARGREQALSTPWDVLVHDGRVFIAMAGTHQIWSHDIATGTTQNWSGTGAERNLNAENLRLAAWAQPSGLTVGAGNLFVADSESSTVRAVDLASGATRTIVGGDDAEPSNLFVFGDSDGVGDSARLQHPLGVIWLESKRRVAVADTYNHRLKLVDPETRTIETWIGDGTPGLVDGPAKTARFHEPSGFALSSDGRTLWVADANNHSVRIVDVETGSVRTLELTSIHAPLPAEPPRRVRLADLPGTPIVRVAPFDVAKGSEGKLRIELRLPEGHTLSTAGESLFQVCDDPDLPLTFDDASARGVLRTGEPIVVPFRASERLGSGLVRVEAVSYYCQGDSACRLSAVLFEVPVNVVEAAASSEFVLSHEFGDLSAKLGILDLPRIPRASPIEPADESSEKKNDEDDEEEQP